MSSDTLDYSNQTSYARTPAAKVAHNRRERERRRKTAASFEHIRELLEKLGYACRGRDKPAVLAAMEFALEQEYEAKRREEPAWSQANMSNSGSDLRKRPRIEVECDSPAKSMLDSAFFSSTIPAVIVDTSGIVIHTNVASTHLFHGLEVGVACKKLLKATSHVDFDQNLHQAITRTPLTNGKSAGEQTFMQFVASLENTGTNPENSHIRIIFNPFNHAGTTLIHVLFVKDMHMKINDTTTNNNIANGTNNESQIIAHPSHFAHMMNAPHFSYPYGISPGTGINAEFTAASMASGGSIDRVNKQEPWQQGGEHLRALLNPIPSHENYISGWPTGSVPPQVVPHYSNGSTTLHQHPQWQHTGPFTQSPAGIRPVVLDGHAFAAQASGKPPTQLPPNMPQYWSTPGMGNVHNTIHTLQMRQPQIEPSKTNQILPISSSPNAPDISSKTTGISPSPMAPTPTKPTENSSRLVS